MSYCCKTANDGMSNEENLTEYAKNGEEREEW